MIISSQVKAWLDITRLIVLLIFFYLIGNYIGISY